MNAVKPIVLILLSLLFAFSACKKEPGIPQPKYIKIGALLPLTGSGASPGESGKAAIDIALEEINSMIKDQQLKTPQFDVIIEDTQTDPDAALIAYRKLKSRGIKLIIGPFSSAVLQTLKPYANADGILLLSPGSVAASIAEPGDNIYRLIPNVVTQGQALNALLMDDNIEAIVPVIRDDIWGNELLKATTDFFSANNGTVIDPVKYQPGITDFEEVVSTLNQNVESALENYPADKIGVYLVGYGESIDILGKASHFDGLSQVKWYGNSAFAEDKNIVGQFETASFANERNLLCPTYGLDPNARQKWEPLLVKVKSAMGREPEIFAFTTYDALWLATQTYQITGPSAGIADLKATFEKQAGSYFGVTGWTTLNNAGDRATAMYDFWGIILINNQPEWKVLARYNNTTGNLERYTK
jgi:branched-chain amino acid transport system substrate-binding protein